MLKELQLYQKEKNKDKSIQNWKMTSKCRANDID